MITRTRGAYAESSATTHLYANNSDPPTRTMSSLATITPCKVASTTEIMKCKTPVEVCTHAGRGIQQPEYLKDHVKQIKCLITKGGRLHY